MRRAVGVVTMTHRHTEDYRRVPCQESTAFSSSLLLLILSVDRCACPADVDDADSVAVRRHDQVCLRLPLRESADSEGVRTRSSAQKNLN